MSLCECGCGQVTGRAKQTERALGLVKGQHRRFIAGHNQRLKPRVVGYPATTVDGRIVQIHQLVAERALGRPLPIGAEVHHVDLDPMNYANKNLVICQDKAYHKLLHVRTKTLRAGGDPATEVVCGTCKRPKPFDDFVHSRHDVNYGRGRRCSDCRRRFNATYVRPSDRAKKAVA